MKNNTIKVLVFVPKGVELLELGSLTDVLGWAKEHGDINITYETFSFHKEVQGAFGNKVLPMFTWPLKGIEEVKEWVKEYEALAIPGGFENYDFFSSAKDERLKQIIQCFHSENKPIATICLGAFCLGEAGILKGITATTYDKINGRKQQQLQKYGCEILEEPVVVCKNIITSTGPATGPYVAIKLIEMLIGDTKISNEKIKKLKEMMGY